MRSAMLKLAIIVILIGLCGCSNGRNDIELQGEPDCTNQDGVWVTPLYGDEGGQCIRATIDEGQSCRSSDDCQSSCVADEGVKPGSEVEGLCFAWSSPISHCLNIIEHGRAQGTVCFD